MLLVGSLFALNVCARPAAKTPVSAEDEVGHESDAPDGMVWIEGGEFDAPDGDANAFASGRGKRQFLNTALVFNPVTLRTIPYSTLGAGFAFLEGGEPIFSFTLLNATDTATTSGFNELFEEGVALAAELRLPTNFFDKPGHQLIGGSWNSRDFADIGADPRLLLPDIAFPVVNGSWSLYWNGDQYLVADPCDPSRGWGVFGRAGISDADPNPISYFVSAGVGGTSPLPGREADAFGIGWYQIGVSDEIAPLTRALLGIGSQGQGVELFYRARVGDHLEVTPDVQFIDPAADGVGSAVVIGVRALLYL